MTKESFVLLPKKNKRDDERPVCLLLRGQCASSSVLYSPSKHNRSVPPNPRQSMQAAQSISKMWMRTSPSWIVFVWVEMESPWPLLLRYNKPRSGSAAANSGAGFPQQQSVNVKPSLGQVLTQPSSTQVHKTGFRNESTNVKILFWNLLIKCWIS